MARHQRDGPGEPGKPGTPVEPGRRLPPQAILYWLLPCLLWAVQLAFTAHSLQQIRHEELSESVRNVYWLDEGTVYDGIGSNVGYYGTLLVVYELFGFELHTAKWVRLGLHLVSLLCLAGLLRRLIGRRKAWLPLLTMGLSPTWLTFNTSQTSYGIDLQYAPLCLALLVFNDFRSAWGLLASALCGLLAMIACMSYPTFLLYLPSLAIVAVTLLRERIAAAPGRARRVAAHLACSGAAFLLPLLAALLYVREPQLLFYDSRLDAGLFRGGGRLALDGRAFLANTKELVQDLFVRGSSYYFEAPVTELSAELLALPLLVVLGVGAILLRDPRLRPALGAAFTLMALSILLPGLAEQRVPGLRRATGFVAGLYAVLTVVWYAADRWKPRWKRFALAFLVVLFPLHHTLAMLPNRAALEEPSLHRDTSWFALERTPRDSLAKLVHLHEQGRVLSCRDGWGVPKECYYSHVFAAIAGYRRWNGMTELPVYAWDWKAREVVALDTRLWETWHFPH